MRPTELVPGNCYFHVGYSDGSMLFPIVHTIRYSRTEDDPEKGRCWVFEDPPRMSDPSVLDDSAQPGVAQIFSEDQLYWILDFPGLLRTLGEVAPDHPVHAPEKIPAVGDGRGPDLAGLHEQVARLFQAREPASLTITIRFTDDGMSLTRDDGGTVRMLLFLRPRLFPEREHLVRALCGGAGLRLDDDYLADNGRTRVLAYALTGDIDKASALCGRLFKEAYAMRIEDTLRCRYRPHDGNKAV